MTIEYKINTASIQDILEHLEQVNDLFVPKLSSRVNLQEFAKKIHDRCIIFEAWGKEGLISFISGYFNKKEQGISFINNISTLSQYCKQGIATKLMRQYQDYAMQNGFTKIDLEVSMKNKNTIAFYEKLDFIVFNETNDSFFMRYSFNI